MRQCAPECFHDNWKALMIHGPRGDVGPDERMTPGEPDDAELLRAVARRDSSALMALYDRYGRLAFGLAYRMLGDAGIAEEAVQDAFWLVWRRADTFDPSRGSGVRAWLLTIVHHKAVDLRRRHGRAMAMDDIDEATPNLAEPDAWSVVSQRLERDRVRAAVAALPKEQQQAIELAYFDGLSHREIAERTGAPLGTIKGRMRLGLRKLARALADGPAP
ncbi:MAG TPA: sigma-70 family RNA polymerase sigma factor [Thermomicrobiales bacterium]|nr:sigma-70 family RNA polymerase sigma factor [Thermomicrobiales bacterium]